MQLTAGLLLIALVLLGGIAVQRFLGQRRDCLLQSKIIASANCSVAVTDATAPRHPIVCVNPNWRLPSAATQFITLYEVSSEELNAVGPRG